MDEEEELDYEGLLFSEDPYFLRVQRCSSSEDSIGETDVEHTFSCSSNVSVDFHHLSSNENSSLAQADQNKDNKSCSDAVSFVFCDAGTDSGKDNDHLASPELHCRTGRATNSSLSRHGKDLQNLRSYGVSSQSLTGFTVPEAPQSESQTQTVRINVSSLYPLDSNSLDFSSNKRSIFVPDEDVDRSSDPPPHSDTISNFNPRSILKVKEKRGSCNNIIDKCMSILCTVPSSSDLLKSAQKVFENACFDEFFNGECISNVCLKDHYYVPEITDWDFYTIWLASLYVILKSPKPKIEILKILVQYFSTSYDSTRTLALAKCIPKLRHAEKLEFALCLVRHLAGSAERKNAVMWVLFITFSDLGSDVFNILMEGLGVFEQDSTSYLDLFNFLNFRAHILPCRYLVKLIEDILICPSPSENEDFIGTIVDFWDRLPETEKIKIDSVISRFMSKFNICSLDELKRLRPLKNIEANIISQIPFPTSSNLPLNKKRVRFAENVDTVRISNPDLTIMPDSALPQKCFEFPDDVIEMGDERCDGNEPSDDDSALNESVSSILAVFKNLCPDWILDGDCQKPMCSATHFLNEDSLDCIPSQKVNLAAEFLIEKSVHPNIQVLEIFVNVLSKLNDPNKLLLFRKCASKLTTADSSKLTILVLSRLSRHMDRWDAIEMVLTPNLLDICNKYTNLFLFDSNLLKTVMTEAIMKKSNVLRCVSDEILRRVSLLPINERENIMETSVTFFRKFILNKRKLLLCPDLAPMESVIVNQFSPQFETELHKGITNNYFVVCLMIKFAIEREDGLRGKALDTLYSFLNIQFSRARILNDILENCIFFKAPTRKSILDLLGNAALCVILRLFEDGHLAEATDIFVVLRKFRLHLFEQEHKFFQVSNVELALIFCTLNVECDGHTDAIEIFLNHCLQSLMGDTMLGSSIVNRINALAEKMFRNLNCKSSWCNALALFDGIFSRQKSLTYPLNILKFYESTLRTTLGTPWSQKARLACLRLFLEMEDTGEHVSLQKATCRSVLLTGVREMYASSQKQHSRKLSNMLHPLIKKLVALCIKAGAYSQFDTADARMTLYSSMTEDELAIYLVWWMYHLIRARKRAHIDYFGPVTLNIVQDCIQDELRLPIHFKLQGVDISVQECGVRLLKVVKSLLIEVSVSSSMLRNLGRGTFELSPEAVRELFQVVVRCLLFHHTDDLQIQHICAFCFDKSQMEFDFL